jgi:hypothetical protein
MLRREELYDRHATALFKLAYAISGNGEAAESAVLEAFQEACTDPATGDAGRRVHQELSAALPSSRAGGRTTPSGITGCTQHRRPARRPTTT